MKVRTSGRISVRTINLVSRDNGAGLSTDMDLLEGMLSGSFDVMRVPWKSPTMRRCDVAIFIELLNPRLMVRARHTVGVFNLDWFADVWRPVLPRLTQVWAKGNVAHEVFTNLRGRTFLTGFLSRDLYDPDVPRTLSCLHLKGHSDLKNTDAVLEAWRTNLDLPPLTVISEKPIMDPPPNVTALERQPFMELKRHINQHRIHVCPSRVEGWGHYITEGLSAGASVITTDASPMNEHVDRDWAWLLPPSNEVRRHLVHEYDVSPAMIASAVREAASLTAEQQVQMSGAARASVAARNEKFKETAFDLLERLK